MPPRKDTKKAKGRRTRRMKARTAKASDVSWNVRHVQQAQQSVQVKTLPKGTKLYRTQPVACDDVTCLPCEDTGKTGVYLGDGNIIPLGMILEYEKPMYLCTFVTTDAIDFYEGKYSFRSLEPERFYRTYSDWKSNPRQKFIHGVDPNHSYNHMDEGLLPLDDLFEDDVWFDNLHEREYFITREDISKLKLSSTSSKLINVDEARQRLTTYKRSIKSARKKHKRGKRGKRA